MHFLLCDESVCYDIWYTYNLINKFLKIDVIYYQEDWKQWLIKYYILYSYLKIIVKSYLTYKFGIGFVYFTRDLDPTIAGQHCL
jgi:hypothetical protein